MISHIEQARRRRQLNQRIRDIIAMRRAFGPASAAEPTEPEPLEQREAA
ncbi:hypothetical protein Val02_69990 [Virgisporangium aliadipatigenens]|uniref:Uncharacterized protein n=1 Tax=Virgisporangium aliadipatigenens TaxID=741659 RepID=A0A8J4DUJ4_9ACTN|nr:hypothetical protein [Virgisporangium aliadipatigenens]GIJ50113.1 hypothetical protein Val02_69990 [Virgisporangium aliadipatigenens]